MGWCFTLESFAKLYSDTYGGITPSDFALRLWGDIYFHPDTRKFARRPPAGMADPKRSFVQFILEPLYKIYSHVIGENSGALAQTLDELGIHLRKDELTMDPQPLLKIVMTQFFGKATGFVDMCVKFIPSPADGARAKIERIYTGPLDTKLGKSLLKCDSKGPLMVHVAKLYPKPDCSAYDA